MKMAKYLESKDSEKREQPMIEVVNAKTAVSFMDAVNSIKGRIPSRVWVRFCFINTMGDKVRQKDIRLNVLYKDWYGECEHCPANDTPITDVHVRTEDGVKLSLADTGIKFGDFMDTLEANFKFRRPKIEG